MQKKERFFQSKTNGKNTRKKKDYLKERKMYSKEKEDFPSPHNAVFDVG